MHPWSVSGSDIDVVWDDNRDGNYEIYYKGSKDGGLIWGDDTRLTNNGSTSMHPFISSSGQAAHVVWNDNRDGNYDIYYKRNPTKSEVGLKELSSSDFQFSVFPNPESTVINVLSGENINQLTISDIYGKQIYNSGVLNPTTEHSIPTSDFPSGFYVIRLKNGNRISVQKFIKL